MAEVRKEKSGQALFKLNLSLQIYIADKIARSQGTAPLRVAATCPWPGTTGRYCFGNPGQARGILRCDDFDFLQFWKQCGWKEMFSVQRHQKVCVGLYRGCQHRRIFRMQKLRIGLKRFFIRRRNDFNFCVTKKLTKWLYGAGRRFLTEIAVCFA